MGFSDHSCRIRFTCIHRKFAVQGMLGFLPEKVPMSAQGWESQQDLRRWLWRQKSEDVPGASGPRTVWEEGALGPGLWDLSCCLGTLGEHSRSP